MKYLVVVGYDDVKLVGNDGDKPITERVLCYHRGLGSFNNYAEAYGHAILHLNDTIDDWDGEERESCTISRLVWLDNCFEMHVIGQKDNCCDWVRIYPCKDEIEDSDHKSWYIEGM
ncbi:MAG: hypothetical protein J6Y02_24915 [Pseudobutyrivibrio sp.]|nr:hypothetical protein [Pseudobutyrivibrio sp.]